VSETAWDVRDLLNVARAQRRREDEWIADHAGALAASQLAGCLRREKLRLLGVPGENEPSPQMLRRWRWGLMYEEDVYRNALDGGRRPSRQVPVEVEVDGVFIRGTADFVFTEGVVETKTTSAWEMHADHLPFPHLIQLGTYMYAKDRPGQLLYGTFHNEWAFDFPALPEMWEPWVREVARLFRENPGDDVLAFPATRLYCASCPYVGVCPTEDTAPQDRPLSALEAQIVERYLSEREVATAAGKREEEAKAGVLGVAEAVGYDERGLATLRLPGRLVTVKTSSYERTDYAALDPRIKAALPTKPVITTKITTKEAEDDG
jgi:hypothetical protein